MRALAASLAWFARRSLPVALCALGAHAVAYRSLVPSNSAHGYLGVYELVVACVSAGALCTLAVAAAALLLRKGDRLPRMLRHPVDDVPIGYRVAWLALASYLVLFTQESVEFIVAPAPTDAAGSTVTTWVLALGTIVIAATVIVLLGRTCSRIVLALLDGPASRPRAPLATRTAGSRPGNVRRRNALADFRALRAPPPLAC